MKKINKSGICKNCIYLLPYGECERRVNFTRANFYFFVLASEWQSHREKSNNLGIP
jgi:RNase P subunit RPR2